MKNILQVNSIIHPVLIKTISAQFSLDLYGIHGITHWARVLENGRELALLTGANIRVVELFAIFHDARRRNDGIDIKHGYHGAEYAKTLQNAFSLSPDEFHLLYLACANHARGEVEGDITVQTCWDADRLDLGRVLCFPDAQYLCTPAAKTDSIRQWAIRRGIQQATPPLIEDEWHYPSRLHVTMRHRFRRWLHRE